MKDDIQLIVGAELVEIDGGDLIKVRYDLTIALDEESRAVVLYVSTYDKYILTVSGEAHDVASKYAPVFRKVKHLIRNQDGGAAIITLDLADVPNAVKTAAVTRGWKFSAMFNMNKPAPIMIPAAERAERYGLGEEFYALGKLGLTDGDLSEQAAAPQRAKKRGLKSVFARILRREKPKN